MSFSTRLSAAAVAATVFLAFPAPAHASDWATAFPHAAVAAHADAEAQSVAVLAADPGSRKAATALRAAMNEGGEASRVADGKSLGSLQGLDDPEIVGKAKALGVDRVLIVRVFEDGGKEAVVSVYDAAGEAIGGFSAGPDAPVEAPDPGEYGHDDAVAESIASVGEDADANVDEFERRMVVFDQSLLVVSDGSSATVSRQFHPRTGSGQPLDGAEFYRYVGQDDLAQKFRRRRATRIGLGVGAAVTSVAGLSLMLGYGLGKGLSVASRTCDQEYGTPEHDMCEAANKEEGRRVLKVGLGGGGALLVGGVVLSIVAARINPHPVSGSEAVGMAQGFNDRLREELGLPKRRRQARKASATFAAGPTGAGVRVQGRF